MGATPKDISASRGAAVLGMSDWSTPVETWLKIMEEREPGFCAAHGYTLPVWEDNAPARWGLAFEDEICRLAENKLNCRITSREQAFKLDSHPFITCHVDGIASDDPSLVCVPETRLIENKTTNIRSYRDKWGEPGTDHIPGIYQIQVQHQMMCTGLFECIVSVLVFPKMVDEWEKEGLISYSETIPGCNHGWHNGKMILIRDQNEGFDLPIEWFADCLKTMGYFHQYPVKANPELQAEMLKGYIRFWKDNVLGETPPEPIRYDDIEALVKEPKGTIIASEQAWRWAKEYKDIGAEIGAAKKRRAQLKTKLLAEMTAGAPHPIDDESVEKWILRSPDGHKLVSWNGKIFR